LDQRLINLIINFKCR